MKIGVPKETAEGERRVALVPDVVKALTAKEIEVVVEPGAGEGAGASRLRVHGRRAPKVGDDAWGADVVLKVDAADRRGDRPPEAGPGPDRLPRAADHRPRLARSLADAGVTSFAMEAIPRITRAQSMDALSSQANVAGYCRDADRRARVRPLLPDDDHRGRHDPARQGARPRRRRRRPAGDRHREAPRRRRHRLRHPLASSRSRSQSLGGRFLELEAVPDAEGEGGYARPLTDEENEQAPRGARRERRQAPGRDHHHRRRSRAARRRC